MPREIIKPKFEYGDIENLGKLRDQNTQEIFEKYYFKKYDVEIISKNLEEAKNRVKTMFGGENYV